MGVSELQLRSWDTPAIVFRPIVLWSFSHYPQKNSTTSCAVKIRRNILNG